MKMWICLPLIVVLACADNSTHGSDDSASKTGTQSSNSRKAAKGGSDKFDAGSSGSSDDDGGPERARIDAGVNSDDDAARKSSSRREKDAGKREARKSEHTMRSQSKNPSDAMSMGDDDGGVIDMSTADDGRRSCCLASDQPGCSDPDLQKCVCDLQPACCSDKWDESCTYIVTQKFCQSGVRECVCGSGDGQWQQADCCDKGWTDTCESLAIYKCDAVAGCH